MTDETRLRGGRFLYFSLNLAYAAYVVIASVSGPAPNPRPLYLCLLFSLCSAPVLMAKKLNDRYAILTIFLLIYFVYFGALDTVGLTMKELTGNSQGLLSTAELAILLGGSVLVLAYRLSVNVGGGRISKPLTNDWPPAVLIGMGIIIWILGTAASWYWNVHLIVRYATLNNTLGQAATLALLVGRLMQPLGILVLAYALAIKRSVLLQVIVIAIACFQVVFGFVSDTKSGAMLGGILVIVTIFLVNGRIPKFWLAGALVFVVFGFPIFQAYRTSVVAEGGQTNAETAANIGKAFDTALANEKRVSSDFGGQEYHSASFVERSSLKGSVEMIVDGTGRLAPFQHGYTLTPILTAFIPRIILSDKEGVETGKILNHAFHVSGSEDTYISPSHLGELYWNFGWPGVIVGMSLLGLLLGYINRLCALSEHKSVTRLMLLAITIQQLCVRFEGSIAVEYVVWLRSIAAILLLHMIFARKMEARTENVSTRTEIIGRSAASPDKPPLLPNLMR